MDFLRRLARRTGRWCRVTCTDTPGPAHRVLRRCPDLTAEPAATIDLNDPATASVQRVLDFSWDVARPTRCWPARPALTDATGRE